MFVWALILLGLSFGSRLITPRHGLTHSAETLSSDLVEAILEIFEYHHNENVFLETCQLLVQLPELRKYKKLILACQRIIDGDLVELTLDPLDLTDRPILNKRMVTLLKCYDSDPQHRSYIKEEASRLREYFRSMTPSLCPSLMGVMDADSLKRLAKRVILGQSYLPQDHAYYLKHKCDEFHQFCIHMGDLRFQKDARIRDLAHKAVALIEREHEDPNPQTSLAESRLRKGSSHQTPLEPYEMIMVTDEVEEHSPTPDRSEEASTAPPAIESTGEKPFVEEDVLTASTADDSLDEAQEFLPDEKLESVPDDSIDVTEEMGEELKDEPTLNEASDGGESGGDPDLEHGAPTFSTQIDDVEIILTEAEPSSNEEVSASTPSTFESQLRALKEDAEEGGRIISSLAFSDG